ncbi:hypothetical protein G7Y79_00002g006440 [Physcia stellaris]|nr:hypothetical protein G7Y79_00002g006440 [Physcia stellaris]
MWFYPSLVPIAFRLLVALRGAQTQKFVLRSLPIVLKASIVPRMSPARLIDAIGPFVITLRPAQFKSDNSPVLQAGIVVMVPHAFQLLVALRFAQTQRSVVRSLPSVLKASIALPTSPARLIDATGLLVITLRLAPFKSDNSPVLWLNSPAMCQHVLNRQSVSESDNSPVLQADIVVMVSNALNLPAMCQHVPSPQLVFRSRNSPVRQANNVVTVPHARQDSLEKKDTPSDELPLTDKFTYWLPSRIPGDPAFKTPVPCLCPSLEICTESGYCVCQSDGLAAAEVPHTPLPPVNLTADSSIPTLFGSGKPTCKHVCNEWAFCICLSGPDCHCGADPQTPTGYELEGKEYHGYHVTQNVSICGQVCTADDFCICKQDSIAGCDCSINTSKYSPFVPPMNPGINPFVVPPKNCTMPGEEPPKLNPPPPRTRPCADICDQAGHCGCE